jgi:lipopolysaccharide/colanic/teichoic acid biosynthesis glycosyltransferase
MVKTCFDRCVAALALLVLSPLLLGLAVAVRLSSPGPVLFRQVRIGRGGEPFTILKFRTMLAGSHRPGAVSPADDPRVTRLGRVMRDWYLDELPQLVNVLRGDMSLVGPRPETPEFVALLSRRERQVLRVRPGLAGPSTLAFMDEATLLAGVDDPARYYADVLLHARVAADLDYARRASLRTDVLLLVRQVAAIVRERLAPESSRPGEHPSTDAPPPGGRTRPAL